MVLALFLGAAGYRVSLAGEGWTALDRVAPCAPDLVLTDLQVSSLVDLALCKAPHELFPTLPAVVMSPRLKLRHAAEQAEAIAGLPRPFSFGAVLAVLLR